MLLHLACELAVWPAVDEGYCMALVEGLGTLGQLRVLRSPSGHAAFLKETDRIDSILTSALRAAGDLA